MVEAARALGRPARVPPDERAHGEARDAEGAGMRQAPEAGADDDGAELAHE
jgi:hypothetical protein